MDFDDVLTSRRSVRNYADREVDRETLRRIVDRARLAPSSYNLQPWEFLAVVDDDRRERLQEVAYGQPHVTDAPVVVAVLTTLDPAAHADRVLADQVEKGLRTEAEAESTRERIEGMADGDEASRRNWATTSAALAAQQLMLAARDEGLHTCPMGGFDEAAFLEAFDVPEGYDPVMLVTVGHAAEDAEALATDRKFRRPVDEVLHVDEFDPTADGATTSDGEPVTIDD